MLDCTYKGELGMELSAELRIHTDNNEADIEKKYELMWDIPCGENPQQDAAIFKTDGMADFEIYDDKTLTYSEIKSVTHITNILSEFYDVNSAVMANNTIVCGVSLGATVDEACQKVIDADPISIVNGAVGFSSKVDYYTAEILYSVSAGLIIAPDYDDKALEKLLGNPNIKIIKLNTPLESFKTISQKDIQVTPFGTIYQDFNRSQLGKDSFKVVTKTKPTKEQIEDAVFAWKISKHTHSNSVVVVKDFKTSAIVQRFSSTVNACEYAMDMSCEASKDAVLASDNIITSVASINAAAQGRISVIIEPGGSANDKKLIELADKFNIVLIFTGIRNYKF